MMDKENYADGITTFKDPIIHLSLSLVPLLHALKIKNIL